MKKTLLKILTVSTLLLFSSSSYGKESYNPVRTLSHLNAALDLRCNTHSPHRFNITQFLSLQTFENLKAYHYGLSFFNPHHTIPNRNELLNSLQSHPQFIGKLSTQPNSTELHTLLGNRPYVLFQTQETNEDHFYIGHGDGIRHFSIHAYLHQHSNLAGFFNASGKNYPNIENCIICTLGV